MNDVTQILNAIEAGDPQAADELLPLVYDELRRRAAAQLAHEKPGQTLNATALVHEAYLRLVGAQRFDSRRHFFAAAAEAMRRILVENARRKARLKHRGDRHRLELEKVELAKCKLSDDILAVDEALKLLATEEPDPAKLVTLRYFAGLTIDEAADAMEISVRTANRHWAFAKAWLFQHLTDE